MSTSYDWVVANEMCSGPLRLAAPGPPVGYIPSRACFSVSQSLLFFPRDPCVVQRWRGAYPGISLLLNVAWLIAILGLSWVTVPLTGRTVTKLRLYTLRKALSGVCRGLYRSKLTLIWLVGISVIAGVFTPILVVVWAVSNFCSKFWLCPVYNLA